MPATWSAPACRACSAGSSASPPCSGWQPLFGVLSIVSVLMIPGDAIDDDEARGLDKAADANAKVGGLTVLLECKPLLILAAALACFHLGNGAMLPLYGLAVVAAQAGRPGRLRRHHHRRGAGVDDPGVADRDAAGREGRLLAGAADLVHRAADPRRHRGLLS